MGKKHITINREEQLEMDKIYDSGEMFRAMGFNKADPDYEPDLCDTCTKLESCPLYDFKNNISVCSNYGKPN